MESAHLDVLIGTWLGACKEIIEQHHGTVNKYLGDGFLAFWPEETTTPDEIAAMLADLRDLQQRRNPEFRIVLHFGSVGTGGIASMGEESLIGKEVNLVFRLEKLAGSLGESCGISNTAHAKLGSLVTVRPLGEHELKGFEGKCAFFGA
jgi:adenylate cyclase